jgi:hypothetical protein
MYFKKKHTVDFLLGNFAIQCTTNEAINDLLKYLEIIGVKWANNQKLIPNQTINTNHAINCFNGKKLRYAEVTWYISTNKTIYTFNGFKRKTNE